MSITTSQLRETVVNEAIARAINTSSFLFVYEYTHTLFQQMIWASLGPTKKSAVSTQRTRYELTQNHSYLIALPATI